MEQLPLFTPSSLSVSEITRYLRQVMESDPVLQDVWVLGEISNLSKPSSGHLYFTLKDANAALRCVIWRNTAVRLRVPLQNGSLVEAHGSINLYERDGQYQLYIDTLRPAGEGQLYLQFLQLKEQLEAEGLFALERKRPLPAYPQRIGLVTSPTGAALQDMLNTLRHRYPLVEVILAPCAVQGNEAPPAILAALDRLNCLDPAPDVILVARGGGSLEDLWAFNDARVVRAIAASPTPIVTGIGHETDFTLADLAADLRAPTPTGAATLATPDVADLRPQVFAALARLEDAAEYALQQRRADLQSQQSRLVRASPRWRIQNDRQRLDEWLERLLLSVSRGNHLRAAQLQGISARLSALDPRSILQRGFAIVTIPDGSVLLRATQTSPGELLTIRLSEGQVKAEVSGQQSDVSGMN
jgi:exodeoxyribonuclease VII large subunit